MVETPDFTIDLAARRVTREGAEVRLTATEWHIVEVLVRNAGRLVTQRQLLQEVWGPKYETETHYLRVYMGQIRRKLEPVPERAALLPDRGAHGLSLRAGASALMAGPRRAHAAGPTRRSRQPHRGPVPERDDQHRADRTLAMLTHCGCVSPRATPGLRRTNSTRKRSTPERIRNQPKVHHPDLSQRVARRQRIQTTNAIAMIS